MDPELLKELHVSNAKVLVEALQSEDMETAFLQQYAWTLNQLGGTFSHQIDDMICVQQLSLNKRLQLLDATARQFGGSGQDLRFLEEPASAEKFQTEISREIFQRAFVNHQVFSCQWELSADNAMDFPCPIKIPTGAWGLAYVEQGQLDFDTGEFTHTATGPEMLLFGPDSPFVFQRAAGCDYCNAFLTVFVPQESWIPGLQFDRDTDRFMSISLKGSPVQNYMHDVFCRIIDITHSSLQNKEHLHINLLEQALTLYSELLPDSDASEIDPRVATACAYITEHYVGKLTVDKIASAANTSTSTLTSLFRSQLGVSIIKWRDQLRMQKAKELLQDSDLAIKVIASEVGYDDPMIFSRRFKQVTGWSPSQVRKGFTGR